MVELAIPKMPTPLGSEVTPRSPALPPEVALVTPMMAEEEAAVARSPTPVPFWVTFTTWVLLLSVKVEAPLSMVLVVICSSVSFVTTSLAVVSTCSVTVFSRSSLSTKSEAALPASVSASSAFSA